MTDIDLVAIEEERARNTRNALAGARAKAAVLRPWPASRRGASVPTSNGRSASIKTCSSSLSPTSSRTVITRVPTTSSFDIGNGNLLAFFDFPGLDLGPYAEVLGGLHHVAISVEPDQVGAVERQTRRRRRAVTRWRAEPRSISVTPDGARMELIADPLGEMYGSKVL